jgi:putative hydrolase of the HAD superfamily
MKKNLSITTLFVDIGDVLLTNGWGHEFRSLAAKTFDLNYKEMETRHYENFNILELGKIGLEEYLQRVVFYEGRKFSMNVFKKFMFAQNKSFPLMIDLITKLKEKYRLKIVVVSNEAREINAYRIKKFELYRFVDFYISSCYVRLCKPDKDIFLLALDTAQVVPQQIVYIDDTLMHVEVATSLGINSIFHTDYKSTRAKLASFGLEIPK